MRTRVARPLPPPPAPDVATVVQRDPTPPGWELDRDTDDAGTWLPYLVGWGIDDHDDLAALHDELLTIPPQAYWTPDYLAPLPVVRTESGHLETPAHLLTPHRQRLNALGDARRLSLINLIASGRTVVQACEAVGISARTYGQWRIRYPDFRNKVNRIRQGLAVDGDVDDSFIARRRHYFGFETYEHHRRMVDAIETTPDGGITLIIVPPEAGKTTTLTDWVSDKIATNPNVRILYVSEKADGMAPAAKVLADVQARMTDPDYDDPDTNYPSHIPEWQARYGPFRDDTLDRDRPWNAKYCKVHKASGRRDYTFQIASWRSKVYGARCDYLIFDDVQSAEGIGDTDRILDRCRKTFFSRPGKKGRTIFIGTRVGVNDVYERLSEEIPDHMIRVVQIPALNSRGESYCPEMWPEQDLANKRAVVGEDGWLTAYMMQPQVSGVNTFSEEMLNDARDSSYTYGWRNPALVSLIIAGLDPALGGGNAIVCAQTTATQFRVLAAQVDYGLARNEDIYAVIRSMCRYRFTQLVVEKNSQQRGLARDDRLRDLSKIYGFRIVEHETGQNKWDFIMGVGAMAGSFIRREIHFPDADQASRKAMEPLRHELLAWRPNVAPKLLCQDLVMALWFTWLIWTRSKRKQAREGADPSWNTLGTPWRPGDMSGRWGRSSYTRGVAPRRRHPSGV